MHDLPDSKFDDLVYANVLTLPESQDRLPKMVNLQYLFLDSACMMMVGGGWVLLIPNTSNNVDYHHIKFENYSIMNTHLYTDLHDF